MCSHRGWLLLLPRHIVVVIVVFGAVLLTPHDECRGNLLQDLKDDRTEAEREERSEEGEEVEVHIPSNGTKICNGMWTTNLQSCTAKWKNRAQEPRCHHATESVTVVLTKTQHNRSP